MEFNETSGNPNITRRLWFFGDGDSAETGSNKRASHAYLNNTDTSGVDIKLIVENNFGCSDTLVRPGYVKILGPIPGLELKNAQGCEPLEVEFTNTSKYYNRIYLDYGDGSVLDSTNLKRHTYRIFDEKNLAEFYRPKLVLYDHNGCFVEYELEDSIYVVQNAIADFQVLKDTGCETFRVEFTNTSKRAFSYEWDFDNDGQIDNVDEHPFTFYDAGKHYPTLIAKSPTNCYDTLRNHIEIYVHAKPDAGFVTEPDSTGYDFPVYVFDQSSESKDKAPLVNWYYDFGEELTLLDTSTSPNAQYSYTNIGTNIITYTITDSNGCTDSAKRVVFIRDTLDPANTGFSYITVDPNGKDIQLNWNKSKISVFKDYHIFTDEAGIIGNIYNSNDVNDTSLMVLSGIDVDNRRYCYTTKITDTCLRTGPVTESHCNVFLRAIDGALGATELRWSHYEGWTRRASYQLYRQAPGGSYELLATLRGDQNVYIDDSLCDVNYCYYVICNHPNGVWKSRSNFACNTPTIAAVTQAPIIDLVTVRGNSYTEVKWHMPPTLATLDYFQIYKNTGANSGQGGILQSATTTSITDTRVKVMDNSYTYTITARDICGYTGAVSLPANSILLQGKNQNDTVVLNWNPYVNWSAGVKDYILEMRNNQGNLEYLDKVSSQSNVYRMSTLNLDIADSLCFRVLAVEDSTVADTSYSNIACIAPKSRVFVPNAFSPNADGLNQTGGIDFNVCLPLARVKSLCRCLTEYRRVPS